MDEKWYGTGMYWYSEYGYINIDIHILHLSSILSHNQSNQQPSLPSIEKQESH